MDIATWKHTVAGPELFICGVEVRSWLGVTHDKDAEALCKAVNQAYAGRGRTFTTDGGCDHV